MSALDYSKWDHIEISDDEDDTHPNVDTPSLFKWRHQARVERQEKDRQEKEKFKQEHDSHQRKMLEMKQKLKESETNVAVSELSQLKLEVQEMEKQESEFRKKEDDLRKKERLTPWNVDTICHEGKSKTVINKYKAAQEKGLTEDEKMDKQEEHTKKNEKMMKKFGMMRRYEDSQELLLEHPVLVCEETANYLVIWCINLEVEEKHDLMHHVAHQTIVMQFILELAKQLETDPRNCIGAFFSRIKLAEKQYMDAFKDELNSFKERVQARAKARIEKAMEEVEEEERKKRLGPGGLDPVEVFESLPKEMQECFESKNIGMLQEVLLKIPRDKAELYMKQCVDSGLWVPGPADDTDQPTKQQPSEETITETPEK